MPFSRSFLALFLYFWVAQSAATRTKRPFSWVVVATFKNESTILLDWIQHYVNEGADHLYLIDNGSQDDYMGVLKSLPRQQMITLVRDSSLPNIGLQDFLMKKYITPLVVEDGNWVLVVDVDEYVYPSDPELCIGNVLDSFPEKIGRIWLPWKVFGSNGHLVQPTEGIVAGFTKRKHADHIMNNYALGYGKSFTRIRSSKLEMLTHSSGNGDSTVYYSNGTEVLFGNSSVKLMLDEGSVKHQPLQLNHYMFQSRDYYQRTKCVRGGGQSGRSAKYTMVFFDEFEPRANAIEDLGLKERQKVLGSRCKSRFA